ncbi:hypothetical protein RFI_24224 [Reticulomyxa filosa]|uniref:Rad21/Rec8-like protein C-terminal eukaryotic domain-containing protein n=1 Tax=Reticulomyxa filosa TaxID=46433 RepID=X6MJA3_RETFI|nr:hypothetical protein RFI_24224 [Reticulomyxa filosa]|eukprot:ETO13150.1 hypothetical protein RFI_24224 [Reticulomyxa filosa]
MDDKANKNDDQTNRTKYHHKKKFAVDKCIDLDENELRMDDGQLLCERNVLHVWREPYVFTTDFNTNKDNAFSHLFKKTLSSNMHGITNELNEFLGECNEWALNGKASTAHFKHLRKSTLHRDDEKVGNEIIPEQGRDALSEIANANENDPLAELPPAEEHTFSPAPARLIFLFFFFKVYIYKKMKKGVASVCLPNDGFEVETIDRNLDETKTYSSIDTRIEDDVTRPQLITSAQVDHHASARVWSNRSQKTYVLLDEITSGDDQGKGKNSVYFDEFIPCDLKRDLAAATFYEMLLFKTYGLIQLTQTEPFGRILIEVCTFFIYFFMNFFYLDLLCFL